IPLGSDKREVKRAYFKLSKEFHPDRYFGKELGPFRDRVGDVFKALSQAADFLSDDGRRTEYEDMIRTQHEMRELERSLAKATEAALEEDRHLVAADGPAETPVEGVPEIDRAARLAPGAAKPRPTPVPTAGDRPGPQRPLAPAGVRERRLVRQVLS